MRSFRYVIADVFTDRALAGNQLAVFTDARDLDELTMQELAREIGFSESVFVPPPRRTARAHPHLHPTRGAAVRRTPVLGWAFVLARRSAALSGRTGHGRSRSSSSARVGGSCSAGWRSRYRPSEPDGRAPTCSRRSAWRVGAARRALRQRISPPIFIVALPSEEGRR